ncbi:MAG: gamma-glutamyltransferase [Nisaea sp.]|uniref:gamma-glutamyltransferase n=1 Tax=Nisaea sp. TaxID=2024842 RepID=UPI001B09D36C|nr:gamma-glutamyltransferase [Nisaea sp.]MBO6560086.1 gamma-glutamyltransferase [Nisaea sp.]
MRNLQLPGRSPVFARNAAIATSHPLATAAGLSILKSGGNAVDAAIAACAVMCVVEPAMTGIGGDCFALYAPKGASKPIALNGSGKAPKAATLAKLQELGIKDEIPLHSPHAVTVPGAIAAWSKLLADHGSKSFAEILAPAIEYAEQGYVVHSRVAFDWEGDAAELAADPDSARIMLVDGKAPKAGSVHRQPELAETLKKIAAGGRDAFYTGEVAEDMVAKLNSVGGLHTMDDFAAADAEYVEPIKTNYRGYDIYECPPNGQGICALMILNILAGFDVASLNEADRVHLIAEATKIGYNQRNAYVADPKFSNVPVEWMLGDEHTAQMRAMVDMKKAGNFKDSDFPVHRDTIYLSCIDEQGNAISFINSLFSGFGSMIMAPKSGVMLHSRGNSFHVKEGHPNCIEPRKRPMHTIIPGFAFKNGTPVAPFGVMGGQYQSTGQANFISNVVDRGLDVQEAMDAPRSFATTEGVLQVECTFEEATYATLEARGHTLERVDKPIGGSQCVWRDPETGILQAGSDPRKDGHASGY